MTVIMPPPTPPLTELGLICKNLRSKITYAPRRLAAGTLYGNRISTRCPCLAADEAVQPAADEGQTPAAGSGAAAGASSSLQEGIVERIQEWDVVVYRHSGGEDPVCGIGRVSTASCCGPFACAASGWDGPR